MADAAVECLVEKLEQLLVQHTTVEIEYQLKKLENDLRLILSLLRDVPKKYWRSDDMLAELIRRIRCAVYEAEDIIDAYVTHPNNNNFNILNIVERVEALLDSSRRIYNEKSWTKNKNKVEDGRADDNEERSLKETDAIVGLEDVTEELRGYLLEESTEVEVTTIVGMAGLGKTILAKKIFHDPIIRYKFPTRIWVYASQQFTTKEILLEILKEFTLLTDDIQRKSDEALANSVCGYLEKERFLLVVDDLWTREDWDKLRVALPMNNNMGKVLITSRIEEVGWHVNPHRGPRRLRFLTEDESFQLLRLEALRELEIPRELEVVGKVIAHHCVGHPLTIALIGGILVKEFSSYNLSAMREKWEKVSQRLSTYRNFEYPQDRLEKIIELCYEKLPYDFRECFLYFGMFPEDFEIPVWKLIRIWIAEGFIQQKIDATLEETAEDYLEELIERKLVRAEKFKLDGKVKTCRIHDLLRDFCISEARREGFSQQIMMSDGIFEPPVSEELKFRRLCIYSNALDFFSRKPYGPSVRSFICSSRDEMTMPKKDLSVIPKGFKLLKVLDVEPINFTDKIPRDMFQLLHLRYLVLSVKLDVLPSAFSQLRNIQTLVVNTSSRTLEVRANIFDMIQLSHFKTKASAALPESSASSATAGEKIQALGTISPESCTKDVFDRVHDLKILGVRGRLALLLDGTDESFDSLGKLEKLEKLKLLNDVFPIPPSGIKPCRLPPAYTFPPNLKILTLSRTSLEWGHMSILGSLERLEVLKLKEKAFMGEIWAVTDGGFRRLEVLHIGRTNLKLWLASDHHFPMLNHLQLMHCEDLQQIPVELADVPSFTKLDLVHSKRAAASAMELQAKMRQLNLSILPQTQ